MKLNTKLVRGGSESEIEEFQVKGRRKMKQKRKENESMKRFRENLPAVFVD